MYSCRYQPDKEIGASDWRHMKQFSDWRHMKQFSDWKHMKQFKVIQVFYMGYSAQNGVLSMGCSTMGVQQGVFNINKLDNSDSFNEDFYTNK